MNASRKTPYIAQGADLEMMIRDVGNELDEQGAEDRAGNRGKSADHEADQKRDRQEEAEAVRRHELHGDRAQSAPPTPV